MLKVRVETLGCKLNQAESESLVRGLLSSGFSICHDGEIEDIYILNTCSVTHIADRKSRHLLRMARRRNPEALIIAAGCYAQRKGEQLLSQGIADSLLSKTDYQHLIEILKNHKNLNEKPTGKADNSSPCQSVLPIRSRIKIQEGCSNYCSYCIVPGVRGSERSIPPQQILNEIKQRESEGYREVILTGTRIGAYSYFREQKTHNLSHLLSLILKETKIERIRLSSLQPQEFSEDLLNMLTNERVCRHLHLPLQSGSNPVLHRMNRKYTIELYSQIVSNARNIIKDMAITTDIIAGFPGESEEEFQESFGFCEKIEFARMHIFPYSPREGTAAATIGNNIPPRVVRERIYQLSDLANKSSMEFKKGLEGRCFPVLWEQEIESGLWSGLTNNYVRVYTHSNIPLKNRIINSKLITVYKDGMLAGMNEVQVNG